MRTPITKDGHKRLSAELENLKSVERPWVIQAIAEARAHGDLSENAEYHSAKEKQGYIEARIKSLETLLAMAEVINPAALGADGQCVFGAYVDLRADNGKVISYQLVGAHEADLERGLLSLSSPVGKALLGKRKDDVIMAQTPDGELEYTVMAVRYE